MLFGFNSPLEITCAFHTALLFMETRWDLVVVCVTDDVLFDLSVLIKLEQYFLVNLWLNYKKWKKNTYLDSEVSSSSQAHLVLLHDSQNVISTLRGTCLHKT